MGQFRPLGFRVLLKWALETHGSKVDPWVFELSLSGSWKPVGQKLTHGFSSHPWDFRILLTDMYRFGEAIVTLAGYKVRCIRAQMDQSARAQVISEFNDSDNDIDVLISSLQLSSQGLNLQKCCHDMLVIEIPPTINHLLQLIARLHRMGQKNEVNITILYQQSSFDEYTVARATRKFVEQWASETPLNKIFKGATLELMGYQLIHAKFGFPFLHYDVDRLTLDEIKAAEAFAHSVHAILPLLQNPKAAQNYNTDFNRATRIRDEWSSEARSLWARHKIDNPDTTKYKFWMKGRPGMKILPYTTNEFRIFEKDTDGTQNSFQVNEFSMPESLRPHDPVFIQLYLMAVYNGWKVLLSENQDHPQGDMPEGEETDVDLDVMDVDVEV